MAATAWLDDTFLPLAEGSRDAATEAGDFEQLKGRAAQAATAAAGPPSGGLAPVLARLHGFDLTEQPVLGAMPGRPGELLPARSTVELRQSMIGSEVLVVFIGGDTTQPVITGVLQTSTVQAATAAPGVSVQVDGERHLVSAEREIVLRCGEASITLTRAGKVIIKGHYILSRSSGYNKIKGAAIELN
jgi:hypothetical protein